MASRDSMLRLSLMKEISQLRRERDTKLITTSEACADLLYHCKRHAQEDYLLSCAKGSVHKPPRSDPYKERPACAFM